MGRPKKRRTTKARRFKMPKVVVRGYEDVIGKLFVAYASLERALRDHAYDLNDTDHARFLRLHDKLRAVLIPMHDCDDEKCPFRGKPQREVPEVP